MRLWYWDIFERETGAVVTAVVLAESRAAAVKKAAAEEFSPGASVPDLIARPSTFDPEDIEGYERPKPLRRRQRERK